MSKYRSLILIRFVIIGYLACNLMLLNSSHYEMLSQLTQQLNSLSTAVSLVPSFVLSDGYLLSDYLKKKGKTLEQACHDTTGEEEVHIDRKAYQDLLGKGLTFENLHIADKFKKHTSFSPSLMGNFTPWALQIPIAVGKVGDFSVIVDCDSSINIYQLRVLTQKRSDCSLHAVKNLLWLMAALDSDKFRFNDYYFKMLDPRAYENFLIAAGCLLNPPEAYRHVVDIYTNTTNQKFLPDLPLNTNNYIKNIIELAAFSPTASSIGAIHRGKQHIKTYSIKEDLAHIALVIKNLEKNIDEKELQKNAANNYHVARFRQI